MEKQQILDALHTFIRQRPGFEPGNYSDCASYRSEMRSVTRDRHDAEILLGAVARADSVTVEILIESFRAYSGRLTIGTTSVCKQCHRDPTLNHKHEPRVVLDYCTGQYFPTEYRKAVCAVLASALWTRFRDSCMPAPTLHHNSETGETLQRYKGKRAGDFIRDSFRREFGARMQRRWFD